MSHSQIFNNFAFTFGVYKMFFFVHKSRSRKNTNNITPVTTTTLLKWLLCFEFILLLDAGPKYWSIQKYLGMLRISDTILM